MGRNPSESVGVDVGATLAKADLEAIERAFGAYREIGRAHV